MKACFVARIANIIVRNLRNIVGCQEIRSVMMIFAAMARRWTEARKMPDYHVSAGIFGEIYAGTLMPKKDGKEDDDENA